MRRMEKIVFFDVTERPYFYFEDFNSNDLMLKIKETNRHEFNICTLDIETFINDNNHKVLCICFFDGENSHEFYLSDYKNQDEMINALFDIILQAKYHNKSIFIHNGSSFDLVFLLKPLYDRCLLDTSLRIDPIIKDGKFFNIKVGFKIGDNNFYVNIKDSFLLLSLSLAKLAKQFKLEDKGMFSYSFVTNHRLNYTGKVPSYNYFNQKTISFDRYLVYRESFKNNNWNLRNEVLKYCTSDCILLYNILHEFSKFVFENFSVNIYKCPSLPSLALKIYRSKFMPIEEVLDPNTGEAVIDKETGKPKIIGSINNIGTDLYNELKSSYFGGHVDMYIPSGPIADINGFAKPENKAIVAHNNKSVKLYDINSLYPSVMKDFKYPNKLYAKFIGDIRYISEFKGLYRNMLGIYRVRVTAPDDIRHPILPYRDKYNVIYPVGTWEGMYCSEELKNAEKYGYSFEILNGYLFTSADLFSSYISTLYQFKETS